MVSPSLQLRPILIITTTANRIGTTTRRSGATTSIWEPSTATGHAASLATIEQEANTKKTTAKIDTTNYCCGQDFTCIQTAAYQSNRFSLQ